MDLDHVMSDLKTFFSSKSSETMDFATRPMKPDLKSRLSDQAFVRGHIRYSDGTIGKLLYLKTTVLEDGLPEDIYGYKRANGKFPDQPTTNQFFDETQFEAYRELGYRIGQNIFGGWKGGEPSEIFEEAPVIRQPAVVAG